MAEDLKNNKNLVYGNDTLEETIGERNQVRSRPSVYFGTNDVNGCLNGVFEIVTNGTDELGTGNGTMVRTIIEEDPVDGEYIVTVIDDGRGVPMDLNPKMNKYNWHLVYNQLFASGKRGGNSAYSGAAGLNGVGAAITQFTSVWMKVISRRKEIDAKGKVKCVEYEMSFEDGEPKGELIRRNWRTGSANITGLTGTGTYVRYKTDKRFFLETKYSYEMIADRLRKLATVAGGCRFELKFLNEEPITLYFKDGIKEYLEAVVEERITKDIFTLNTSEHTKEMFMGSEVEYDVGVNVAFTFSNKEGYVECFNNNSFVPENGTHLLGAVTAIQDVLEQFGQREGKLAKKERILKADIEDILCIICSSTISNGEYCAWSGQDKRAINNQSLYNAFRFQVTEAFRLWLTTHKEDGLKIIQAIKLRKEAREKADQIKKKLVKQLSTSPNDLKTRPTKLNDCSSRNIDETDIYFVEGDSAASSAAVARSPITQAIYPLTGVILNCEKASAEQILNNRVIREMIQIIGTGIDINVADKHMQKVLKDLPKFDIKKLNYGRLIILTDADLDGYHIACLLLVFFAKLMPELLRQRKIYIAQPPLYKIILNSKKNEYEYCLNDNDLAKRQAELAKRRIKIEDIKRFKGLGEMQPEELHETVMNPQTRILLPVEFNDEEGFHQVMKDLLGDNIDERKAYIRDYFLATTESEIAAENEYLLSIAREQ